MDATSLTYIHDELACSPLNMSSGKFQILDETSLETKIQLYHLQLNNQIRHIFICPLSPAAEKHRLSPNKKSAVTSRGFILCAAEDSGS